jgi:hypothetical protein
MNNDWDLETLTEKLKENPDLAMANSPRKCPCDATTSKSSPVEDKTGIKPLPNKYMAQKTGHYASKKEAKFADELLLRQKAGEIWFWLEQVPFRLPGPSTHRVDFMVFYPDVKWELIEIKGRDLPMGKLKRRQVEDIYKIKIKVI